MSNNLIFLHIPKNGGVTFNSILEKQYFEDTIFSIKVIDNIKLNTDEFINLSEEERRKIRVLTGHMLFGLHKYLYGKSQYITFLRKPLNRIISFYYFVLSSPHHRLYNQVIKMSLYDFAMNINQGDVNNAQIRMISGIDNREDIMLEKALVNIDKFFPIIGLLECFNESLILLKEYYGWHYPVYSIRNKTKNRITSNEVDSKTKNAIIELNRGDYQLYDIIEKKFYIQQKKIGQSKVHNQSKYLSLLNILYSNKIKAKRMAKNFLQLLKIQ